MRIGASIGIALAGGQAKEGADAAVELLRQTDGALYTVKRAGRGGG